MGRKFISIGAILCGVAGLSGLAWGDQPPAGSVVAWGYNEIWSCIDDDNCRWFTLGQCNVPSPNTGFVAVAGGYRHSLGLKADGSIVAWGDNFAEQCDVPSPNTGFVAISAEGSVSMGLKANGSILAWGGYGNLKVPSPNTGFVAISGRLGLKADGSIVAWGVNDPNHYVPLPNTDFVAISAGSGHNLGLKADGSIVAWGNNGSGQCNVPSPNAGFVAIAVGYEHSLGLKADGTILAWGSNMVEVWDGHTMPSYKFSGQCIVPAPNSGFVAIAAGGYHSLGLKADGTVVAWGSNYDEYARIVGQSQSPHPNTGFVTMAAGDFHSLAIRVACPNELVGDLKRDCAVNLKDLAVMVRQWMVRDCGSPLWCEGADLTRDGRVGIEDLAVMAEEWMK
jgi:hypothetical protein